MSQAATVEDITLRVEEVPRTKSRERPSVPPPAPGPNGAPAPSAPSVAPAPTPTPPKKKSKAKFVALGLLLLAAGWRRHGLRRLARSRGRPTTAEVEGHVQTVAARTSGQVAEVRVKDNDLVEEGQIVAVLDKSDLEAKVAAAEADVAAADASIDAANAQLALT